MERLALADSLLIDVAHGDAVARGFELHLTRFADGVRGLAGELAEASLTQFFDVAIDRINTYVGDVGPGFPRFECWQDRASFRYELALRPAPQRTTTIPLTSVAQPAADDGHLKGPNIERYGRLMRRVGGEALLVSDEGYAVEGTTTSLVWWIDGALCSVAPHTGRPRVSSVTERLILGLAADNGVVTEERSAPPTELAHAEVWALNALHGIRQVQSIDGVTLPQADMERLTHFRQAYERLARPLR